MLLLHGCFLCGGLGQSHTVLHERGRTLSSKQIHLCRRTIHQQVHSECLKPSQGDDIASQFIVSPLNQYAGVYCTGLQIRGQSLVCMIVQQCQWCLCLMARLGAPMHGNSTPW